MGECYAELGMTDVADNAGWQTCLFPEVLNLCEFTVGDGVGGSEASVGAATSMQECAQLVLATSADANGDGAVDRSEYLAFFRAPMERLRLKDHERLKSALEASDRMRGNIFQRLDRDSDARLSRDEWDRVFTKLEWRCPPRLAA